MKSKSKLCIECKFCLVDKENLDRMSHAAKCVEPHTPPDAKGERIKTTLWTKTACKFFEQRESHLTTPFTKTIDTPQNTIRDRKAPSKRKSPIAAKKERDSQHLS